MNVINKNFVVNYQVSRLGGNVYLNKYEVAETEEMAKKEVLKQIGEGKKSGTFTFVLIHGNYTGSFVLAE